MQSWQIEASLFLAEVRMGMIGGLVRFPRATAEDRRWGGPALLSMDANGCCGSKRVARDDRSPLVKIRPRAAKKYEAKLGPLSAMAFVLHKLPP